MKGRLASSCAAIFIMKLLWSVNRYTYKEIILAEELAPLICKKCGIGLYRVIYTSASCISTFQFKCFAIE